MANSFTVAGLELLGTTTNPEYRLATGIDTGQILPVTASLSSLVLDGAVITGETTGNRVWQFTILVNDPARAARLNLSTFANTILQALNADTFPVVWTPDSCPSTNYTAFRATVTPAKSIVINDQLWAQFPVSFETGPFGLSSGSQTIVVPASGAAAQLQVDGMNSGTFTGAALSTTTKYEGAGSAKITAAGSGGTYSGFVSRPLSSIDLSSYAAMSVRVLCSQFTSTTSLGVSITLKSSGGRSTAQTVLVSMAPGAISWRLANFSINPADLSHTGFSPVDLTAVTSYEIDVAAPQNGPSSVSIFLDDLRAYPPGSVGNSTAEGAVLTIPAVIGSARTPVALEIDRAGSTFTSLLLHRPPVDQDPDATILAGLTPSGSNYIVTVPDADMNYDDTFSVVVALSASGASARTITATFTQEQGGTIVGTQTITMSVPAATQTLLALGLITLPIIAVPPENSGTSLFISISSTNVTDAFSDVALCSTSGQTVLLTGLGANIACEAVYVDPPAIATGVGHVYESGSISRLAAVSADRLMQAPGGMIFDPGNDRLLAMSKDGAPGITVTYTPAWLDEALI